MAVDLTGKRIIITGAAGVIGAAATRMFTAKGAHVLTVDIDETGLKDLAGTAETMVADVRVEEQVAAYVARAVEVLGGIDGFLTTPGSRAPSLHWVNTRRPSSTR